EHRQVLGFEMRGALEGHGAADVDVGGLNVALAEAEEGQQVERHVAELGIADAEALEEIGAEGPLVEDEFYVERRLGRAVERGDLVVGKTLGAQGGRVDAGCLVEVA